MFYFCYLCFFVVITIITIIIVIVIIIVRSNRSLLLSSLKHDVKKVILRNNQQDIWVNTSLLSIISKNLMTPTFFVDPVVYCYSHSQTVSWFRFEKYVGKSKNIGESANSFGSSGTHSLSIGMDTLFNVFLSNKKAEEGA